MFLVQETFSSSNARIYFRNLRKKLFPDIFLGPLSDHRRSISAARDLERAKRFFLRMAQEMRRCSRGGQIRKDNPWKIKDYNNDA